MNTITINIPDGKEAVQEEKEGSVIITFKDKSKNIMERVKTFQIACNLCSNDKLIDALKCAVSCNMPDHIIAHIEALIVAEVLNEGWKPDLQDHGQRKWIAYFEKRGNEISFFGSDCYYSRTGAHLILSFRSQMLSDYFGQQFIEIHRRRLG
jgi:hypothetical protein